MGTVESAGIQDAKGFRDAGRLVATDRAGHVAQLALAKVVAGSKNQQREPPRRG